MINTAEKDVFHQVVPNTLNYSAKTTKGLFEYDQFLAVFTQSIVSASEQLYDEIGPFLPCQASFLLNHQSLLLGTLTKLILTIGYGSRAHL